LIALIISNTLLLVLLVISLRFNYKIGVTILDIQDTIEDSLDELDNRYASMSEVLERPIFFDSMEIRQVVSDISRCRDSVLRVAASMGSIDQRAESIDE
jgi:hypothetical protein|tara:strand:- start:9204 stop:9500 length:297 start_codon:yes stop_codon:yes gene_type:complete